MPLNRHAEESSTEGGLETLTKEELYQLAQEQDLAGRSTMSREELVVALAGDSGPGEDQRGTT